MKSHKKLLTVDVRTPGVGISFETTTKSSSYWVNEKARQKQHKWQHYALREQMLLVFEMNKHSMNICNTYSPGQKIAEFALNGIIDHSTEWNMHLH